MPCFRTIGIGIDLKFLKVRPLSVQKSLKVSVPLATLANLTERILETKVYDELFTGKLLENIEFCLFHNATSTCLLSQRSRKEQREATSVETT